ncbi:MAG: hypothetical protein ABS79_03220 [Planctomycetes bacterium SCN 63-9]|nr:MAG: hypothetical protein ABS79_03220 [Planctomycetes bacterium SCN 63-9]
MGSICPHCGAQRNLEWQLIVHILKLIAVLALGACMAAAAVYRYISKPENQLAIKNRWQGLLDWVGPRWDRFRSWIDDEYRRLVARPSDRFPSPDTLHDPLLDGSGGSGNSPIDADKSPMPGSGVRPAGRPRTPPPLPHERGRNGDGSPAEPHVPSSNPANARARATPPPLPRRSKSPPVGEVPGQLTPSDGWEDLSL